MPQVSDQRNWLNVLLALAVAIAVVFGFTSRANSAPPVDELIWSESCEIGIPTGTLTAIGNGRWATVIVEMRVNGGDWISPGDQYNPWRIEHDTSIALGFPGVIAFRAADAKNNGSLVGDWVYSDAITCP